MSETYHTGTGQKVTTHYAKEERTAYEGNAKGDSRKEGESRVEQNRRLREESRAVVSSRPDARENVEKETKRKKAAHEKIDTEVERVRGRQVVEELEETAVKKKKAPKQQRSEPISNHIGNRIPAALGGMGGAPSWINRGMGTPPALMMRSGSPPPWLFGKAPAAKATKGKRAPPTKNTGLPPWFRY